MLEFVVPPSSNSSGNSKYPLCVLRLVDYLQTKTKRSSADEKTSSKDQRKAASSKQRRVGGGRKLPKVPSTKLSAVLLSLSSKKRKMKDPQSFSFLKVASLNISASSFKTNQEAADGDKSSTNNSNNNKKTGAAGSNNGSKQQHQQQHEDQQDLIIKNSRRGHRGQKHPGLSPRLPTEFPPPPAGQKQQEHHTTRLRKSSASQIDRSMSPSSCSIAPMRRKTSAAAAVTSASFYNNNNVDNNFIILQSDDPSNSKPASAPRKRSPRPMTADRSQRKFSTPILSKSDLSRLAGTAAADTTIQTTHQHQQAPKAFYAAAPNSLSLLSYSNPASAVHSPITSAATVVIANPGYGTDHQYRKRSETSTTSSTVSPVGSSSSSHHHHQQQQSWIDYTSTGTGIHQQDIRRGSQGRSLSASISPVQITLVRKSWQNAQTRGRLEPIQAIFHQTLFKSQQIRGLFHKTGPGSMKEHLPVFLGLFTELMDNLEDTQEFSIKLRTIGAKHVTLWESGFRASHFDAFAQSLLDTTLKWGEKSNRTLDCQKAWSEIASFIVEELKDGFYEAKKINRRKTSIKTF